MLLGSTGLSGVALDAAFGGGLALDRLF